MIGQGPNPSGLCQCGCGETTPVATYTIATRQIFAGCHLRFIPGHHLGNRGEFRPKPAPTPAEIRRRARTIRASWTPEQRRRRGVLGRQHWTVPEVSTADLSASLGVDGD